jgi:two-component system OmpR family sensor kinase
MSTGTLEASERPDTGHSLRKRLVLLLFAAITIFAAMQGIGAYRSALQQADAMFDYHLQQMAHAMPRGFDPRPPQDDAGDYDLLVQIWGPDGVQLFRSPRSALPKSGVLGFSDVEVQGRAYRVYTVQTPLQTVQIAQDVSERNARARALAAHAVLPVALMAPLLMLVVWWVVTRSLAPVNRARSQVATRAADDLSPLEVAGLPSEVKPLVVELNDLFSRVRSAFEAQQNFVADAAHELRSPLAALKLQAQALRGHGHEVSAEVNEATRQAAVIRLNQGIDRAIRLVEQLLTLARAEGAQQAAGPLFTAAGGASGAAAATSVDLQHVLRLAVSDALPQAQAAGLDLGVAPDAVTTPVHVQGDTEALRNMLRNLIDNAIKYTLAPGQIDIDVQQDAAGISLAVDDSGPGIAEADRARVFDRFYRAPEAAAQASGSGLGLSIVRAIAQRHGASLELAHSDRLGGLRVLVRFPV